MPDAVAQLSEKQREALRLIGRGHDAKSCARALGRSVHTVNERLRDARRILGVSSSREAARMLLAHEEPEAPGDPQSFGDEPLGDAAARTVTDVGTAQHAGQGDRRRMRRTWFVATGAIALSLAIALAIALAAPAAQVPSAQAPAVRAPSVSAEAAAQDAALAAAARRWLELAEAGDYAGSYAATAASFRKANTLAGWQDAASALRARLGDVMSRELVGVESVPTPPDGNEIVVFQTKYALGGDKIETIALVREGGGWKVVGAYVE
ncbi:helix-turn-helix domain-containing protein [Tsuneonella amylolytica]|uniref:helix-turn-helix domain-containing protein n=1 Tax=Tsuneonella amylolytica TaxID=2338327 RepID=UPI000EA8F992|nr:DUF4019 domain-containing protein [Tsuneonella amylolytica]